MTKGGARARSGPAPDPNALRRDRASDSMWWEVLPAEGRNAPAPHFPLLDPTDRELDLWSAEWARPQAMKWEQNGQENEVALYVRTLVAAEQVEASAALRVLVLRQQEHLGLTMAGLARNRWKIGQPAAEPVTKTAPRKSTKGRARDASVRNRLQVLDGGS